MKAATKLTKSLYQGGEEGGLNIESPTKGSIML